MYQIVTVDKCYMLPIGLKIIIVTKIHQFLNNMNVIIFF